MRLGKGKGLGLGSGLGSGLDPNLQHAVEAAALVEAELHELLEASGGERRPLRHHLVRVRVRVRGRVRGS